MAFQPKTATHGLLIETNPIILAKCITQLAHHRTMWRTLIDRPTTYALALAFAIAASAHTKATAHGGGVAEWRALASLVVLVKLPGIHRAAVLVATVAGGGGNSIGICIGICIGIGAGEGGCRLCFCGRRGCQG